MNTTTEHSGIYDVVYLKLLHNCSCSLLDMSFHVGQIEYKSHI